MISSLTQDANLRLFKTNQHGNKHFEQPATVERNRITEKRFFRWTPLQPNTSFHPATMKTVTRHSSILFFSKGGNKK